MFRFLSLLFTGNFGFAACFQNQLMKLSLRSFIRHLKFTSALSSQNYLAQISLFLIMLGRYVNTCVINCCILFAAFLYRYFPYGIYFQVQYQSDQFLDKNKDYVVPEHQDLLGASKCTFVAGLFPPLPEESSKTSKFSSIGSRFKVSFPLSSR